MAMQDWEAAIPAQFMRTLSYRKEGKAAIEKAQECKTYPQGQGRMIYKRIN